MSAGNVRDEPAAAVQRPLGVGVAGTEANDRGAARHLETQRRLVGPDGDHVGMSSNPLLQLTHQLQRDANCQFIFI
jgi:hypothetical protein